MEDLAYLLTFLIAIGLVAGVIWLLYILGNSPGRIASERAHAHAAAISVCGWLGLLIVVLWPVPLVWAYATPEEEDYPHTRTLSDEDVNALALCGEEMDARGRPARGFKASRSNQRRARRSLIIET